MDDWDVSPEPTAEAVPHSAAVLALEKLLPDQLRASSLHKSGDTGGHLVGERGQTDTFASVLDTLRVQPDDYAYAVAEGRVNDVDIQVGAMRVAGVDGARLLGVLVDLGRGKYEGSTIEDELFEGRSVTKVTLGADLADHGPIYLHPNDETVFWIQSLEQSLVSEALALLP